jgi:hypothetical protein
MLTDVQQANSQARVRILSDKMTWVSFEHCFQSSWQTKELRNQLALANVYVPLVGEWAMWSFHELGREEAKWKRKRGEALRRALRMAIAADKAEIECCSLYTGFAHFSVGLDRVNQEFGKLIEENRIQMQRAEQLLEKAENGAIFDGRRIGTNWNCLYLELLQAYISFKTGWNQAKVITSIACLVQAAHYALRRRCPVNIRSLLQKTLRHFENNPNNTTIVMLARALVRDQEELYRQFPRVLIKPVSA